MCTLSVMYVCSEDSRKNSYKTTSSNGAGGFHRDTKKKDAYGTGRLVCLFPFSFLFSPSSPLLVLRY